MAGTFAQEARRDPPAGLPPGDVEEVVWLGRGPVVRVGGRAFALRGGRWEPLPGLGPKQRIDLLAADPGALGGPRLLVLSGGRLLALRDGKVQPLARLPRGAGRPEVLSPGKPILIAAGGELFRVQGRRAVPALAAGDSDLAPHAIRAIARRGRDLALATDAGVLRLTKAGWKPLRVEVDGASLFPQDVRGAVFDRAGRLWVLTPLHLLGERTRAEGGGWRALDAKTALPRRSFTALALGRKARGRTVLWLGTARGATRVELGPARERLEVHHRAGRRWLPSDEVRGIAVSPGGQVVWIATAGGVGAIERWPLTFPSKAATLQTATERYHKRTRWGFVGEVGLTRAGDPASAVQRDSDNDGLWTALYGAAACFEYAVTRDPQARARARGAFEALRFLGRVTQGGARSPPPGFVARTVLPTTGPDPNRAYTLAADRWKRAHRDRRWKLLHPRWPKSADGEWWWKADTSSDELDGHFFFYALYYDLVASSPAERAEVAAVVAGIVDHLLDHGLRLIDWDGKPTRWADFSPASLNHDPDWEEERGLNSLSILSYLKVAERVTGAVRYREAARRLIRDHAYAQNVLAWKPQHGVGTGNQSDDELAVLGFYSLLSYEDDPALRAIWARAFARRWELLRGSRNPFFTFAYAAVCGGETARTPWGERPLAPSRAALERAVEALRRFPLDRVSWSIDDRGRGDLRRLHPGGSPEQGCRADGTALPLDERFVSHWNVDPWRLRSAGQGRSMADGVAWLLPYYLARYHRLLAAPPPPKRAPKGD